MWRFRFSVIANANSDSEGVIPRDVSTTVIPVELSTSISIQFANLLSKVPEKTCKFLADCQWRRSIEGRYHGPIIAPWAVYKAL